MIWLIKKKKGKKREKSNTFSVSHIINNLDRRPQDSSSNTVDGIHKAIMDPYSQSNNDPYSQSNNDPYSQNMFNF